MLQRAASGADLPSSEPTRKFSEPRIPRALVGIPPAIQQIAARQLVARWGHELGNPPPTEITKVLVIVVGCVLEMQITPAVVIDARAQTKLGGRLLELMSDEVMRNWRTHGITEYELSVLLLAIARVRDGIANADANVFAAQLGGSEGLQLLEDVAHDMRSPLASILYLADTLQRGESGPVNDVQREQLGLICTAALGLSSVGNDIIDLTRSELLLEPNPVPFSVTGVLESVRDIVRPVAEVKHLEIIIDPPRSAERLGHPVALSRVLLNLTTNALKFTERGFVELYTHEPRPGWIEFAVRDSGRGINPKMMPTLFDPVRPARPDEHEARVTKLFSNTGLGLTICRKLVESMGSKLRVETHLGHGTRFSFELELPPCPLLRVPGRISGPHSTSREDPPGQQRRSQIAT